MGKNNKANMFVDCVPQHNEVTGSCIYCTVRFPNKEKVKFIVDCGLFQEERYQEENNRFIFSPEELDFALVTHNHIDHIGRIPKLYKDGFRGKTYASKITSMLMPYALNNTAEILCANAQKNSRSKKVIEASSIPVFKSSSHAPLYSSEDVEYAMENVIGKEFNESFEACKHVAVTFIQNGHLLGASCILVTITYRGEKPIYLLFSGDYSNYNVFFDIKKMPKFLKNVPLNIIQESTYGNSSKEEIVKTFRTNLIESLKKNNSVIIPVFSLGRSQEILYELKKLQDSNVVPKNIPIYLDGKLAQSYTKFYLDNSDLIRIKDFLPENLTFVTTYEMRQNILRDKKCKILLTTSGMGNYGPAQLYLPYFISNSNCSIHFCGYTTPNTLGYKLKNAANRDEIEINGAKVIKRATVYSTNEFSGHAKSEDLIEFLRRFKNVKSILINHGEEETKKEYVKKVIQEVSPKAIAILRPYNCIRIGAYGIIKSYQAI